MAISASQIVKVLPRVITAGANELEISGLFLTDNALATFPGTTQFHSAAAVGEYFGQDSEEYKAAVNYFLGYNNSFRKPQTLHFARMATSDIPASLVGGTTGSLEDIKKVTKGTLVITIDGTVKTVNTLDFSSIQTESDAAKILQTTLTGTTVSYNGGLQQFTVNTVNKGTAASLTTATGTAADVLGLSAAKGATASKGSKGLTPYELMDSIVNHTQNWVSFTTMTEAADDAVLAFAKWANDTDGEFLYCPYTTKDIDTDANAGTNLPKKLADAGYEGTVLSFGGRDIATLVMAIGASVDWNRVNGLPTWAFKSQDGLAATITDTAKAEACVSQHLNYYGRWATRNDEFIYYYQGAMSGGDYGFVDAYIGALWLRNVLQVSLMNGLANVGRVPYNDDGYALIRAWCADPIDRALVNGVIQRGIVLSERQKSQLFNEIGKNVADEIYTDGYHLQIEDPGAQARVNRETPTMGLWYTYGGAVHRLELPVTAVL